MLDVACGDGYGSSILAKNAARVFGADNDEKLLSLANKLSPHDKMEFHLCDARSLPFPDNYFDVAVSMETIEHFTEQEKFLGELKRVVKRGGVIMISTPDHDTNEKMGVYHNRNREGHGHPGEMTFAQFFYLMNRHLVNIEFYGQLFLTQEPTLRHRIINLVKKIDILKLRRLFAKDMRDKYNLSAKLISEECQVKKLDRQSADILAVGRNEK